MKTTLRIIGRVIGKLTYVTTAFLISVVATVAIFGYAGYYYYEGYYKDYMKVQNAWSEVDNGYTAYLNVIEDNLNTLSNGITNKKFETADAKTTAETKLKFLKENVRDVRYSMTYKDKMSTYPLITNAVDAMESIVNQDGKEDISTIFSQLDSVERELIKDKKTYNTMAREFNQRNEKFPESIIADVGSFHAWIEIP